MKLPLPEHLCWLALRRVRRGGVARLGDRYLEGGRPLGVLLAELLADLLAEDLLTVAEPHPEDGLARVSCTEAGQARYRELCRRQRAPLPVPPPEFTTTTTEAPASRRQSTPRPFTAPGGQPGPALAAPEVRRG